MLFDASFIQRAIPDSVVLFGTIPSDPSFSIDSRTTQKGDLFIALVGERVDGHDYIQQVLDVGAAGIIIEHNKKELLKKIVGHDITTKCVILVRDTLDALISLAAAWRAQFSCSVVAITGSVGKTTTRTMIGNILDAHKVSYITSRGNQNTLIGAALNILRMRSSHNVALFECGISQRGEMKELAALIRPTVAAITSVGHSHMAGLGTINDIAAEKRDIFSCFTDSNVGIINGDQAVLAQVGYRHPVIRCGSKTTNHVQARKVHVDNTTVSFTLKLYQERFTINLHNTHAENVHNASTAAAVAHALGVPHGDIVSGIQVPINVGGRYQWLPIKDNNGIIIHDCYNANPESMKAALLAFQEIQTPAQKIAVLGDMLELGAASSFWHRQIGRFLRKVPSLKQVILVGDMIKIMRKTVPLHMRVHFVPSWQEATELLSTLITQESMVLVKGSRGMALDKLVNNFTTR